MWARLHDHATSFPSWGNTYIPPYLHVYIYSIQTSLRSFFLYLLCPGKVELYNQSIHPFYPSYYTYIIASIAKKEPLRFFSLLQ